MKLGFHVVMMVVVGLVASACSEVKENNSADAVLMKAVQQGTLPGVIGMAASSKGVIYQGAAGLKGEASDDPIKVDTILRIASMTKAVTSVAVMQLVEQGQIALDSPVGEYLPRFSDVQILEGFGPNGDPLLKAPRSSPTVRHLLSHSSGYVYSLWNEDAARMVESGRVAGPGSAGDDFLMAPLAFEPGSQWEYGISTDVLGVLVEKVSGLTLEAYFREHIFEPLKMLDSGFIVPKDKHERVATAFMRRGEGALQPIPQDLTPSSFFSGGGGLYSTAADYIRFLRAMLRSGELDGARILTAETVSLMGQNQIGSLEAAENVKTLQPAVSNDFSFFPGSRDKFGLGFLINSDPVPGGRAAGSLAWAGLYNTYFWIDPNSDICGVVMTQLLPFFDDEAVQLLSDFESAIYQSR